MDYSPLSGVNHHKPRFSHSHSGVRLQDCIQECLRCYQTVLETIQYCIQRGGEHVDPHHLKVMQTCTETSRTSAALMMLQSPYYPLACDLCAQVCRACAKSCSDIHDDAMRACEQMCFSCAESCEGILSLND
jgi:hypothetical protein